MIPGGIFLAIFGAILYICGQESNNSFDQQWEYFWEDAKTNPGDSLETFGVLLMIGGIILIIVGAIKKYGERQPFVSGGEERRIYEKENIKASKEQIKKTCANCGAEIDDDSLFCNKCGAPNSNFEYCPKCGERIKQGSLFCNKCACDIFLYKSNMSNASANELLAYATALLKNGDFKTAAKCISAAERKGGDTGEIAVLRLLENLKIREEKELEEECTDFTINMYYYQATHSSNPSVNDRMKAYGENYVNKKKYVEGCSLLAKESFEAAKATFEALGGFKDSREKAQYAAEKLEEERKEEHRDFIKTVVAFAVVLIVIVSLMIVVVITGK